VPLPTEEVAFFEDPRTELARRCAWRKAALVQEREECELQLMAFAARREQMTNSAHKLTPRRQTLSGGDHTIRIALR